jgi:septal ring factor EnvC (AmiA/AmiB activator)
MYWLSLEILSLREELSITRTQLLETTGRLQEVERRLDDAVAQLEPLRELGPRAVWVAQRLHALAVSYPALHSPLARCLRPFTRRTG